MPPLPADLDARVTAAADVLRRGGLVAYPTETFYGLGALARDEAALGRLARAKLRPEGKPLPLLAADVGQVEAVAGLTGIAARLAARFWPGPLTLVLPALPGLDPAVTAGAGTVAIRVPGSEVARALARRAGGAIVSTSANLSGEAPPTDAGDLSADLLSRIDHVLDGGRTPGGLPSTIVEVEGDSVRLLREGAIPFDAVRAAAD
ncbi:MULTISPECIES: L-threonylcarbamoyladenylate synthase [Anaeromyxobacter]|uniref:L-threonylcarbamoyladenylate synthase n=1 Tax=Anaeromyxobacter TaxID=161492 RepID=UPI001F58C425|nr:MULTISPECIES: L-threonylcarbamoyladenylate synthase [unclassified Anaeromyxobacter]